VKGSGQNTYTSVSVLGLFSDKKRIKK